MGKKTGVDAGDFRRFTIEIEEAGGQIGSKCGELSASGDVSFGPMKWEDEDATQETVGVSLWFDEESVVEMTGDAWRNLEDSGQLHLFVRLAALSASAAQEAADMLDQEDEPEIFEAVVTRDLSSESCTAFSKSDDAGSLIEAAERLNYACWSENAAGSAPDIYLAEDDGAIEVDVESYLKGLMEREIDLRRKQAAEQATRLVEEIARLELPTSKECKAALQSIIGKAQALLVQ